MKAALPSPKLKETWQTLTTQAGPLQRQAEARFEKQARFDIVYVTLEFEKAAIDAKVVLDAGGLVSGLWFVPTREALSWHAPSYAKPDQFIERDVTVGSGEWALPGTLTLPKSAGPFPAVVLVHGSGPHDRDETIGPNKPFKDLAWGLASRGIAVLRYEKRTKEHGARFVSGGAGITVKEETVDDAVAAVDALRRVAEVDPRRIYVLGHSLGGMLVPRIAEGDPAIAGFVIMAGSTRPLAPIMLSQSEYIAAADGTVTPEEKAYLDDIKRRVALAESTDLSPETPASALPFGVPASYWLDLRGYDPADAAKAIDRPILILQGERDYQVTMEDFEAWRSALADRRNVTFKTYPSLNHLFIVGVGPSTPGEYSRPDNVSAEVVVDIARWVEQRNLKRCLATTPYIGKVG